MTVKTPRRAIDEAKLRELGSNITQRSLMAFR
jgi:hypothetical protein